MAATLFTWLPGASSGHSAFYNGIGGYYLSCRKYKTVETKTRSVAVSACNQIVVSSDSISADFITIAAKRAITARAT